MRLEPYRYAKSQIEVIRFGFAAALLFAAVTVAAEGAGPLAAGNLLLDIARAGDRLVAVGERGHVLYSDDGGRAWQDARVPVKAMLTAVFFVDSRLGWAVGHDGVIISTHNGGADWELQRDGVAAQHAADLLTLSNAEMELARLDAPAQEAGAAAGVDVTIRRDTARVAVADAKQALAEPVFAPPLMDVWFRDRQYGIAVGAYASLLRTEDGGRSWRAEPQRIDNPEQVHYYTIAGAGGARLLIAGETGSAFRSLDDGASWTTLQLPVSGTLFGAVLSEASGSVLLFGLQGEVLRSSDFGTTWEAVVSESDAVLAGGTRCDDGTLVLVGSVGSVLLSSDNGASFEALETGSQQLNLSAAVQAADGTLVLVGQNGVNLVPSCRSARK